MSLAGRTAIVTGAGRGIGFAIARLLCEGGMHVALNDLDPQSAERAARQLIDGGHRAIACPGDVTKRGDVAAFFDRTESESKPASV